MTSGPGTYAAELIQSRNANASEALAIFHAHTKTFKSRMAAVGGSRLNRAALLVAAGVVGAILMMTVESRWVRSLPTIYTVSAIVFVAAVGMRIWVHSHYKRCAEVFRQSFKANRRFVMDENALRRRQCRRRFDLDSLVGDRGHCRRPAHHYDLSLARRRDSPCRRPRAKIRMRSASARSCGGAGRIDVRSTHWGTTMTSGQRQGPALEIVQTRDISAVDRRDLDAPVGEAGLAQGHRPALHQRSSSLVRLRRVPDRVDPDGRARAQGRRARPRPAADRRRARLRHFLRLARIGSAQRLAWDRYWACAQGRRPLRAGGGRPATGARGAACIRAAWTRSRPSSTTTGAWSPCCRTTAGVFVVKAAFEGQDVEGFGAELVRRWQAQRGAAAGAPA